MDRFYDEFSKSLAASVPRRESLRRMGAVFAGAVLGQWGLGTAWAAGQDPCKPFCNRCRNKTQQNQCLAACRACNGNTGRLGGSCGSFVCCEAAACNGVCSDLQSDPNCGACGNDCGDFGETCCGNYCADLANDFDNCGRCGAACNDPGPYEDGECFLGECVYLCVEGAIDCNGICTSLDWDPVNCGACGNVCGAGTTCQNGTCQPNNCVPNCPTNWCGGDGCGGTCGCPADSFCMGDGWNMCVPCDGACP
jgi:Stigma-specific protein, Stig1